ncbi:tripartite tricarboxylate transporter TctB family protein [Parathalassolituus penaei]|uniref:Tripartite tricarboxylate transporter TctB family protein n=1 Tax=Parathalassolituus penaei TaxID=2997323 RepID=A0A9X3IVB2_9GAMM|nr:tripartite tricarboxylate transporter TctB family protein [Parathalassolituus penaei]MCY0967073.1 tripartite tricarboxylate transporter TctB family protein [Parathalassolituus penaei]
MSEVVPKQPGETLFGFLMLALSLFLFWQSYEIAGFSALSSPGAFPMAVSAIMVISSCVAIVHDFKRPADSFEWQHFFERILPPVVGVMIGIIFVFAVMLETVGFLLTAFAFLVVTIKMLHKGTMAYTTLISALGLVVIYLVFRVIFVVVLPEGLIPESDIMSAIKEMIG